MHRPVIGSAWKARNSPALLITSYTTRKGVTGENYVYIYHRNLRWINRYLYWMPASTNNVLFKLIYVTSRHSAHRYNHGYGTVYLTEQTCVGGGQVGDVWVRVRVTRRKGKGKAFVAGGRGEREAVLGSVPDGADMCRLGRVLGGQVGNVWVRVRATRRKGKGKAFVTGGRGEREAVLGSVPDGADMCRLSRVLGGQVGDVRQIHDAV